VSFETMRHDPCIESVKAATVPELSRFRGIVVAMYYLDHDPPHVHAAHGGRRTRVTISPPAIIDEQDRIDPRAERFLLEWIALHEHDLLRNWDRARRHEPLERVPPLP
jgi:hypothetical protein